MRASISAAALVLALLFGSAAGAQAQSTTTSQQDRMKSCSAEAKTQKLKGDARKSFMSDCLSGHADASGAAQQQPTTKSGAGSPSSSGATSGTTTPPPASRAPAASAAALSAGQYKTEAEAKRHCPSDTIVWANNNSKIYHFSGTHDYGNTKSGGYMCQQESNRDGFRAAKNEKPPAQ